MREVAKGTEALEKKQEIGLEGDHGWGKVEKYQSMFSPSEEI